MPMIVAVPPGRSMANDCSAVVLVPIASNEYGTPPPVMSFTISTGSAFEALIVSVAPICRATSSFDATVSIAMMRDAPAIAAPFTADSPMPPQPITATVAAGLHLRRMEHRADTGHHAATHQRAAIERHVVAHLHHGMLVHQHVFGEGREVERLVQHLALPGEPPRGTGQQLHLGVLAEIRMAGHALRALAAEHRQAGDHVIAWLDVGDVLADRLDHAGRLVAQHAWRGERIQALDEMQVGVTQAGVGGAHQHLAALQRRVLHVLDGERLVRLVEDSGLHGSLHRVAQRTLAWAWAKGKAVHCHCEERSDAAIPIVRTQMRIASSLRSSQ